MADEHTRAWAEEIAGNMLVPRYVVCPTYEHHGFLIDEPDSTSCPWCERDHLRAQLAAEKDRAEGWRHQVGLLLAVIKHGYQRGGGCSREGCACASPMMICEEFLTWADGDRWCARCGWESGAHPSLAEKGDERG